MNNKIVIKNREPQQITINGGGEVIGITTVLVNGIDVTEGNVAYVVVPTKTSELINDSGFITQETDPTIPYYIKQISQADINRWNNKQEQLVSGVNIKTINENSLLGSGNIDISTTYTAGYGININASNEISNTITSYNDLTDLPTIPTSTSELINDSDYVTSNELSDVAFSGSYADLSNIPEIPDSTSDLINDSGFITKSVDDLENYYNKDVINETLPNITGSGTIVILNDTVDGGQLKLSLSASELTQDATPTPSSPQEVHTISGSNTIKVFGTNFIPTDTSDWEQGGIDTTTGGNTTNTARIRTKDYYYMQSNINYYISVQDTNYCFVNIFFYDKNKNYLDQLYTYDNQINGATSKIITISSSNVPNIAYIRVLMKKVDGTDLTPSSIETIKPMMNIGSTATTYEPYVSQEADIDLGDIEYCKIGNYKDRIFKNVSEDTDYSNTREDGAWYIKKNIGKVVLDGSEYWAENVNWNTDYPSTFHARTDALSYTNRIYTDFYCDKFKTQLGRQGLYEGNITYWESATNRTWFVFIDATLLSEFSINGFKTWLSNNNMTCYYVLSTPTYTKITGTLAEQLEYINNKLKTCSTKTTINQVNEDLGFVINAETITKVTNAILTDYVKNTDYATASTGGVIKVNSGSFATTIYNGQLSGITKDYVNAYPYMSTNGFITKGTLENVITGKNLISGTNYLVTQDYLETISSIASGGTTTLTYDITKSGYTPIAISGFSCGNSAINIYGMRITSSTEAQVSVRNIYTATSTDVGVRIYVLYVKE